MMWISNSVWTCCGVLAVGLALVTSEDPESVVEVAGNASQAGSSGRSWENLRFPVSFETIANRSVVLEHFPETNDLRVRSIADVVEDEVVEVAVDVDTMESCSSTAEFCQAGLSDVDYNESVMHNESIMPPPSLQSTDRLVRVDGQEVSALSFQDVIDSPVGSVIVLPLFKPLGSVHILSGFARVEILSPQELEFEPTTEQREGDVVEWLEAIARQKAEQEARELEIANNKKLQERLEMERREEEARIQREWEMLEKMNKEEYERTRMTPHDMVAGKRRDGLEFRYEVEFATRGPIGLNWDLNTEDKAVVSHLDRKLPAEKMNVIAPRDQLIALNGVDTSKMGPQEVVDVYLGSSLPRKLVFLVQMSSERAAAKAAAKAGPGAVVNWTLAFSTPEVLNGWEVRLHLAKWSASPELNTANDSSRLPMRLAFSRPITGCNHFSAASSSADEKADGVVYLAYRGGCSFIDKANTAKAANGKALVVVNNVNGDGRFNPTTVDEHVDISVLMMAKLDGELIMSVMEHQEILAQMYEERPDQIPTPLEEPKRLTNQELAIASNAKKSARTLTFWYINATPTDSQELGNSSSPPETLEFQVLPALFGGKIPTIPYRIVAAYPQETACHSKGLGIFGTRAVVLVKRGGCSFGVKMRAVQDVGGAGMLLLNSDESLIPLMTDPREVEGLKIWGASIGLRNGTAIQDILAKSKTLPTLVKIYPHEEEPPDTTDSPN